LGWFFGFLGVAALVVPNTVFSKNYAARTRLFLMCCRHALKARGCAQRKSTHSEKAKCTAAAVLLLQQKPKTPKTSEKGQNAARSADWCRDHDYAMTTAMTCP